MDSTILRLILLAVGILFLVGIYLFETKRRKKQSSQANLRQMPEFGDIKLTTDEAGESPEWVMHEPEPDNLDEELVHLADEMMQESDTQQEQVGFKTAAETTPAQSLREQTELFSLSAKEESPVDVPSKIIQINLMARHGGFAGREIEKAVRETGLQSGEMQIYHRYTTDGSQKAVFNMASMVEPGNFPLREMEGFNTPGLTLFAQLPGPGDSLSIFSDMLYTAERLAALLDGVLQDETRSTLTKQTIENIRAEIMEHRRLVQLARSKR